MVSLTGDAAALPGVRERLAEEGVGGMISNGSGEDGVRSRSVGVCRDMLVRIEITQLIEGNESAH